MTMGLIGVIEAHHAGLMRALDDLGALAGRPSSHLELGTALEALDRALRAHELTAERFVVGPLRHLQLLDCGQLAALRSELDGLTEDAFKLSGERPAATAIRGFVRAARAHIRRRERAVVPAARAALADGSLQAAPAWFVDEVYGRQGGPGGTWSEKWLG